MSFVSTHTGQQIDDAVDSVISKESSWDSKAEVSDITDAINALDVSDIAVAGKYISSVSEVNGKIQVTRADLPQGGSSSWGDIMGNLEDQLDLKEALDAKADTSDIPDKVSDLTNDSGYQTSAEVSSAITTAINGLNKSGSPSSNQYISVVRQSAGIIETQKATLPMHTAGNGISVSSGTVSAKLGSGLSFDANGAISATGGGGGDYPAWVDEVPSANQNILKGNPNRFTYLANSYTIPASGEPYWVKSESYLNSLNSKGLVTTDGFDDYMSKHSFAESGDIPTKVSDLTNDSGFITAADIPAIPTKVSDLTNDSGFQTSAQVSTAVTNAVNNLDVNQVGGAGKYISAISESNGKISATATDFPSIPSKTSDITNDSGFITSADIAGKQDTLTPGVGILISENTISVSQDVQPKLTAGSGISIDENFVISATGGGGSSYDPGNRVVISNASQFSSLTANTCYEINKDFTVSGTYTIPEGVSFFFAGGSISGGTWNCPGDADYTAYWRDRSKRPRLLGDVKFNKANYSMTWNGGFANDEVDFEWFNPSHSNASNSNADLVAALVGQLHDQVLNIGDMYPILKPITITTGSATIQSKNQFQGGYAAFTASCSAGFYIVGKLFSAIVLSDGRINLKGITLLGATGFTDKNRSTPWALYGSRNAHNDNTAINVTLYDRYFKSYTINSGASGSEYPNSANFCGLDLQHGSVELVEDCCFNGFCRGISLDATKTWSSGTPGFFNRCFISTCKWGVFAANTSDFFFTNCKINSCNSDCATGLSGSTGRNIKAQGQYNTSTHRHEDYGGGVYISASNMIQFDCCRWEFNYMGIYLDNACSNINFTGGIFDRCTHSVMTIYNDAGHYITTDQFPDRHNPAVSGVNFTGNNILRGVGSRNDWEGSSPSLTPGVAYFCVYSRPDSSTDAWVTRADGLRKLDLHIAANTFEDNMEMAFDGVTTHTGAFNPQNLTYENSLFMFDCTDNGGVDINLSGNDFSASKAAYFSESYNSSSSVNKGYVTIKGGNNSYPADMDFSVPYYHSTDARKNAQIARLNEIAFEDGNIVTYDTTLGGGKRSLRWEGTLAQYSALATHYDDTDYLITE